jgi:prepilin-type N-terminal cleavage/methylation domain-containing protein
MKSKGFTLVELVIVIVIIGILSIIAIPIYRSYIEKARLSQTNFVAEQSSAEEITLEEVPSDHFSENELSAD